MKEAPQCGASFWEHVVRGENETARLHLKTCPDVLPVSRRYLHHFRAG
jgi:hypothetical protein